MKTVSEWLDEYSESHQNKTNKLIHWVCVPLRSFFDCRHLGAFQRFIDNLTSGAQFYFLCTFRLGSCSCNGSINAGNGMAHLCFACWNGFLYRNFCFGVDWAVLWSQS